LYYQNNFPLAIVEAKDNKHSIGDGMQQALDYAETLNIPFAFSSNGDGFLEHDRTKNEGEIEQTLKLEEFPSPEKLYQRYLQFRGISTEQQKIIEQSYYDDGNGKMPR
jgi:type I restriction enzyme R subunit